MRGPGVLLLVLAVLAIEAVLLTVVASRRSPMPRSRTNLKGTLANLAAGTCLVLAMLASTLDASWGWIALCLTGAFLAHLIDLRDRW